MVRDTVENPLELELEALKTENAELKRENEKLQRSLKLKNKKLARVRKREERLIEEIDELDTFEPAQVLATFIDVGEKRCRKCGAKGLEDLDLGNGRILEICNVCLHRHMIKRD